MKIQGILFIILFVCAPIELFTLDNEQNNTLQKPALNTKMASNTLVNESSSNYSLELSEEARHVSNRNLHFKTYSTPTFGETYQGIIRASDVTIDSIVNGDAEDDNLYRWTDVEYAQGETDTTTPKRLDESNPWGYSPKDGDYSYFFDVDSTQLIWVVDYYADNSIPSKTTEISFSFNNAWESDFTNQPAVDLHITFDFNGFDVTFFLYTQVPGQFSRSNETDENGHHYLYFLVNSSWGSGWHNIGPINISAALLEQNMYTESSLPSYFTFNEVYVGVGAFNPFKLHLLVDNLSVKSKLDPNSAKLTVNSKEFANGIYQVEGDVQKDADSGKIGFKIASTKYDDTKCELDGKLFFDIRFLADLNSTVDWDYGDEKNVEWVVNFNVDLPQIGEGGLYIYKIHIWTPPEWNAISLTDQDSKEQIGNTIIERRTNDLYIRLQESFVRLGAYQLKAHGPNYIIGLEAPASTNHISGLPLNVTLLRPLEQDLSIRLEKLPNNEVILKKTISMNTGYLSTTIKLNGTIRRGNYQLITTLRSQFQAGIQIHNFTLTTDWAVVKILSGNTVVSFREYTLIIQCLDYATESIIENGTINYSWGMGNGTMVYNPLNKTYTATFRANATPNDYTLAIYPFAEDYVFGSHNMTLQILESDFVLDLTVPENITGGDTLNVGIILKNSNGQPIEEVPIRVYLNGTNVAEAVTSKNGQVSIPLLPDFQSESDINVTVIAIWEGQVLTKTSKSVHMFNSPLISEEINSKETDKPIDNFSNWLKDELGSDSSLVYTIFGVLIFGLGTGILFLKRARSKQGSAATESDIANKSENTEEDNHPHVESTSEVVQTRSSPLLDASWRLRGIQSVDDFAKEMGLSSKELIQLINKRNSQVSKEKQWRIVAEGQLIIPPDSKSQKSN